MPLNISCTKINASFYILTTKTLLRACSVQSMHLKVTIEGIERNLDLDPLAVFPTVVK